MILRRERKEEEATRLRKQLIRLVNTYPWKEYIVLNVVKGNEFKQHGRSVC